MATIILNHKTYGEVYAEEEDFHSSEPVMWIKCKTAQYLPKQGLVKRLKVGKGAIKEQSEGYLPKHRNKSLAEQYLPLANSVAAKMRSGNDDYDELCCIAALGLVKACDKYTTVREGFAAFARMSIENEIRNHWREQNKHSGVDTYDGDWDLLIKGHEPVTSELFDRITLLAGNLRPRLREIIHSLYLADNPQTAKELAYKYNISEARVSQLKQEAIGLLREML